MTTTSALLSLVSGFQRAMIALTAGRQAHIIPMPISALLQIPSQRTPAHIRSSLLSFGWEQDEEPYIP